MSRRAAARRAPVAPGGLHAGPGGAMITDSGERRQEPRLRHHPDGVAVRISGDDLLRQRAPAVSGGRGPDRGHGGVRPGARAAGRRVRPAPARDPDRAGAEGRRSSGSRRRLSLPAPPDLHRGPAAGRRPLPRQAHRHRGGGRRRRRGVPLREGPTRGAPADRPVSGVRRLQDAHLGHHPGVRACAPGSPAPPGSSP